MHQDEEKLAQVLDAKQLARLKQLQLQQQGARALGQNDVADTLKLSDDQRQRIHAALEAEGSAMRSIFEGSRQGNGDFGAIQQKIQQLRSGTDAKLKGLLTSAQKTQFQQMQGEPFTFPQAPKPRFALPPGGGFPGGPGGPAGPGGIPAALRRMGIRSPRSGNRRPDLRVKVRPFCAADNASARFLQLRLV